MARTFLLRLIHKSPSWFVFTFGLLLLLGVNRYARQSLPEDSMQRISTLKQAGMLVEAEQVYEQLLEKDPLDLDLNYDYIQNHFQITSGKDFTRDDAKLVERYDSLATDSQSVDLGWYGRGLIHSKLKEYDQAIITFIQIPNQDLKYLNFSLGQVYLEKGEKARAEKLFLRELSAQGNLREAVPALAKMYLDQGRIDDLRLLSQDSETGKYVGLGNWRRLAFETQDWLTYLTLVVVRPYQSVTPIAGLSALIICLVWLIFLRRVEVFHQKPFYLTLLVLVLGSLSANLSLVLGELLKQVLPALGGGEKLWQLTNSIIHIGVVEEVAKILPVLAVVFFVRRAREPFDLIVFASLSALGFATIENALYFTYEGLGLVAPRFLYSSVMHISMTSIACYLWARARYIRPGNQALALLAGLLLAAVVHGLFDFFLMMGAMSKLTALSFALTVVLAREYHRMLRNTLNFSPNFSELLADSCRLKNFELFFSATLVSLTIVYLYYNLDFSTDIANQQLLNASLTSLPAFIAVFGSLGKLSLEKGRMLPLNVFKTPRSRRSIGAAPLPDLSQAV
jgi:RsiW-degrading membrane proteinase PrsW (M82 family)